MQSSDLAFDLNYTIFDFEGRSGRIDQAKARLLAFDFSFNDAHRRVIYVARGNLATALGTSPLQPIPVQPIDQISTPEGIESSVDQAIDRALQQRPDLLKEVAEIRSADARVKEAKSAYFPILRMHAYPDLQSLYGMQQTLP